jgi:hypothetical protein
MDNIHHDLNTSDRLVRGIGSVWGSIANYFTSATPTATSSPPTPATSLPPPKSSQPKHNTKTTSTNPTVSEDFLKLMTSEERGNIPKKMRNITVTRQISEIGR